MNRFFLKALVILLSVFPLGAAVYSSANQLSLESIERRSAILSDGTYSVLNGTQIQKENNLIGIVRNSKTGKAIAGVPVTDGYTFAITDRNGVYQLKADKNARLVYYSLPRDYEVSVDPKTKFPAFFAYLETGPATKQQRNDFALTPMSKKEKNFTLLMIGDPQAKKEEHVGRFKNETMADIMTTVRAGQDKGRFGNVYAFTLGDMIHDTPELWDGMADALRGCEISPYKYLPIFNCVGNHDHDAAASNDIEALNKFRSLFGPSDYSLDRAGTHIVVMDNVVCKSSTGKKWIYDGGFTPEQIKWLKQDLSLVKDKENKMIVLVCHIPFRKGNKSGGSNMNHDKYYTEVLDLMAGFKEAHIMIGHTHYPNNYIHPQKTLNGLNVYEHVHGASSGGWWFSNLNVDGSPNGFSIYDVRDNAMHNWVAKATGRPESFQMRVYDGNQIYGDKYNYTWYSGGVGGPAQIQTPGNPQLKGCFVVSLWNDDPENWQVFFRQGGKDYPMTRVTEPVADMCATSFFFNERGKNSKSWDKAVNHYWYFKPQYGVPSNEKDWEVVAVQTIPGSGVKNVYKSSTLQTDYSGF